MDGKYKAASKNGRDSSCRSLKAFDILLVFAGVALSIASFREGVIIGSGLFSSGVLFWLSGFGGLRGWRYFPLVLMLSGVAALLLMCYGCFRPPANH